jgi:hypothetical protein
MMPLLLETLLLLLVFFALGLGLGWLIWKDGGRPA